MRVTYKNDNSLVTFSEPIDVTKPYPHKHGKQFRRTYENKLIGGKKPLARFNRDIAIARKNY